MTQTYRISVDHHKIYGIKNRGKYGLTIVRAGATSGNSKEISSDQELRDALFSLGYTREEIGNTLELLTDNKDFWHETREFDESVVAALGF